MGEKYIHLTQQERYYIEILNNKNKESVKEIAEKIGRSLSTIYRELKRARSIHRNSDYTEEEIYVPELAQQRYWENMKNKGRDLKIGKDIEFANYIEKKIIEDKYSPEAALYAAKAENFETSICTTTLYSYIEKGVFLNLTNEELPSKKKKKRKYKKVKVQKKAAAGTSIEKRPKEIDNRDEITDYEMDTVMGGQGISKKSFLVLTERRTRLELLFLLKSHTAKEVVRTLNYIEKLLGTDNFRKLFRSITVDNGTEFSDAEGMAKTRRSNKKRTDIYYCHPYRSSERGTNENNNKLVRRHHPKGTVFDDLSRSEVRQLQDWMNTYPRRMFKGETSAKRFKEELDKMDFGDKKDIVYGFFLPRAAPEDI